MRLKMNRVLCIYSLCKECKDVCLVEMVKMRRICQTAVSLHIRSCVPLGVADKADFSSSVDSAQESASVGSINWPPGTFSECITIVLRRSPANQHSHTPHIPPQQYRKRLGPAGCRAVSAVAVSPTSARSRASSAGSESS